jgi:hypothetical protein
MIFAEGGKLKEAFLQFHSRIRLYQMCVFSARSNTNDIDTDNLGFRKYLMRSSMWQVPANGFLLPAVLKLVEEASCWRYQDVRNFGKS